MSTFLQSQFAVQDKHLFDFSKPDDDSNSDEDEWHQTNSYQNLKDQKKQKKLIDIEAVKLELNQRPSIEDGTIPIKFGKKIQKASQRNLSNIHIPTSSILIEQLTHLKTIKIIKEQVPPEIIYKVYSQFRYQFVPAYNIIYRQGDRNKYYYIILEGKCVVMKPREKMVGINQIEEIENNKPQQDPYGLKSLFPDYLILKTLFMGDSFGEAAIKLEISRASTVYAIENCHLIYLSEAAYVQLLDPYLSQALDQKMKYFIKNQIFNQIEIDMNEIMGIMLECHLITYKAGDIIYEEGHKANHIFFIINGQVELSKKVGIQQLVISSYGEFQQFGEIEILNKIQRYTKARVLSPRMSVYKIRKNKFFNNLGNFIVYENMKKKAQLMMKHWQLIVQSAQEQLEFENNHLSSQRRKKIQNKSISDQSQQLVSQVKVFSHMTENYGINDEDNQQNNIMLTKVYSNALQTYQAKLKKLNNGNDKIYTKKKDSYALNSSSPQARQDIQNNKRSFHVKLPTISPHRIIPQMNLDQVLDSISKLPKANPDNLVISLMYQQAYKSNNPDKRAKKIQQIIQASFRNVRKYESKEKLLSQQVRFKSTDSLVKNLKSSYEIEGINKQNEEYLNIVKQKKII